MAEINGFLISVGIFVFPLTYFIGDIVAEVYGYKKSLELICATLICGFIFSTVLALLIRTPAPNYWHHEAEYISVLGSVFRFYLANTLGIIIGQILNVYIIAKTKVILRGKYFWLRSICSSSLGELITSLIADLIAFLGVLSFSKIIQVMISIYIIKLLYAALLSWPGSIIAVYLKIKEDLNTQDYRKNYNIDQLIKNIQDSGGEICQD
ncbi:MAG: queuosine precursor transporter [Legionellales bacterium]|nr:queuosine precursor transporter [Legionellales bacterium]